MLFSSIDFPLQDRVGLIGFWASITSCGGAFITGHFSERLTGYYKSSLLVLLGGATLCFIWMGLIVMKIIPYSIGNWDNYSKKFYQALIGFFLQINFSSIIRVNISWYGPKFFMYPPVFGVRRGNCLPCRRRCCGGFHDFLVDCDWSSIFAYILHQKHWYVQFSHIKYIFSICTAY